MQRQMIAPRNNGCQGRIGTWTFLTERGHATVDTMSLLTDLRAFAMEHERCGELDGGVDGDRVWMACTCALRSCKRSIQDSRLSRDATRNIFGGDASIG